MSMSTACFRMSCVLPKAEEFPLLAKLAKTSGAAAHFGLPIDAKTVACASTSVAALVAAVAPAAVESAATVPDVLATAIQPY